MRILLIILSLTFISCSPFISKELRRKNKCNRKLERVVKTCPELLQHDTIIDAVIVEIPQINDSTTIEIKIDSTRVKELETALDSLKGSERIEYVNRYFKQSFSLDTSYTISNITAYIRIVNGVVNLRIEKPKEEIKREVKTPYQKVAPKELTITDHIMNGLNKFWWWLIILAVLYFILRRLIKF